MLIARRRPASERPKSAAASDDECVRALLVLASLTSRCSVEHEPSSPRRNTVPSIDINIDPNDPGIARGDQDNKGHGSTRTTVKSADTKPGGQQKGSPVQSGGKAKHAVSSSGKAVQQENKDGRSGTATKTKK